MEEDIQNYSPTVMFRETPCTLDYKYNVFAKTFKQLIQMNR